MHSSDQIGIQGVHHLNALHFLKYSHPTLLSDFEFIPFILLCVCTLQPASLHPPPSYSAFSVSAVYFKVVLTEHIRRVLNLTISSW